VTLHLSAGLGSLWTTTVACESTTAGTLRFYAAVRPPAAEVSGNTTRPTIAYPNCRVIRALLGSTAQSGQCEEARGGVCFCPASNTELFGLNVSCEDLLDPESDGTSFLGALHLVVRL
jgi:hypothetical protein